MDIGCVGNWFLTLLTDNAFVDTIMSMSETIASGLWKAATSGLNPKLFKILADPAKLIGDAKKILLKVSSTVGDALEKLKDTIESVVGGRRLEELGEGEQHIAHMHRILTNDEHRERLAMLIGLQKLDEAAAIVFPEHFDDEEHRDGLGKHMRRLTDDSSMDSLIKCFTGIGITHTVDW